MRFAWGGGVVANDLVVSENGGTPKNGGFMAKND